MTKKIANERTPLLENSGQHPNHLINKNIYIKRHKAIKASGQPISSLY